MEITGKIILALPERGGVAQRTGNEWKVRPYVLETLEQYPKKMVFEVFGVDRIAQFNIQVGETLTVSFDIDAHEYQDRWFNSIRAWKVDRNTAEANAPVQPSMADNSSINPAAQFSSVPEAPFSSASGTDELPF